MVALITEAQWRRDVGAHVVTELTSDDPAKIANLLLQASDYVAEYAVMAGVTLSTPTPAMVRRVAIVATYYAADEHPQYRDTQGRNPYWDRYQSVTRELKAWAERTAKVSTEAPSEGPLVLSDERRGY